MRTSIIVQNLKCRGCAKTISSKLSDLNSISEVKVNLEISAVVFNCLNSNNIVLVKEKLKAIGYPSIDIENSVLSKAKSFVSCSTGKISN